MIKESFRLLIKRSGSKLLYNNARNIYWSIRNKNLIYILRKLIIKKNYQKNKFYLNIGGFIFLKRNWRVLEYISESYPISKYLIDYDVNLLLNQKLPLSSEHVDLIYTSHTLEHLLEDSVSYNIREQYRILKKNGVLRIVVPDIDILWGACKKKDFRILNYFGKKKEQTIPEYFLSTFSIKKVNKNILENDFDNLEKLEFLIKYETKQIEDLNRHDFSTHICWFNFEKIRNILIKNGFEDQNIRKCSYLKSKEKEMRDSQFFDNTNPEISLFVECVK